MLSGKIIVISGGAGLLGREFVSAVAEQHGVAVVADINREAAEAVTTWINEKSSSECAYAVPLDIASPSSIQQMLHTLHERYGKIDAIVNNAYPRNKNYGRSFFEVEYEDFCENVNLHLGGYFLMSQLGAKYFKQQGFGNIVNIASIYGVVAPRFELYSGTNMTMPVEYAAIKSAIIHFTRYLAAYLKGTNIRINAISPGGIHDSQPESFLNLYKKTCSGKGMLDRRDLNGTLLYLLSDMSKYLNGQNIIIDDGFSL